MVARRFVQNLYGPRWIARRDLLLVFRGREPLSPDDLRWSSYCPSIRSSAASSRVGQPEAKDGSSTQRPRCTGLTANCAPRRVPHGSNCHKNDVSSHRVLLNPHLTSP